jgi:dolichol-phosphate mannosyltransferase
MKVLRIGIASTAVFRARTISLAACSPRPRCQLTGPQPNVTNYPPARVPEPGNIMSKRRAASSRNVRGTSSESAPLDGAVALCLPPPTPTIRSSDTLIFAPTYNESATIGPLLDSLLDLSGQCDVLIVDDSSSDGTREVLTARAACNPRLRVIVRSRKLGIGSAHKLAWSHARAQGYARIVTLDADLSHDPSDIPRLLTLLDEGADVALGSRFMPGGRLAYQRGRMILSRGANLAARWLLRLPITEYTSSLRAARLNRVPPGLVEAIPKEGYTFFLSSAVGFVRQGLRVREIPICFHDRQAGVSKIPRGEIFRAIANLIRLALFRRRQS